MEKEADMIDDREKLLSEYEQAGLVRVCEQMIEMVTPMLEEIAAQVDAEYDRQVVQYISSRVKTPDSIYNKLIRKGRSGTLQKAVETLHDMAGIRVVCSFQDDVYHVMKEIRKLPGLKFIKVKDYIAHPKQTGYRSIHMIAEVPSIGTPIRMEIQVRSAAMNYWAMLDHQLSYKNKKMDEAKFQKMQKELKTCAIEIADIDKKFLRIRKNIDRL
ncbi:MAG: GTP pyrophosphokinase [Clostridiales bacterium]|nr:GTP pyrophosphokinase [Clostridiales bacterium]MCD8108517.1 GTP pyrophosphokinase [Clostridiales bacterium]MCD8134342.1 GTP pyrophosphokinase [Clostridiales bacterium]